MSRKVTTKEDVAAVISLYKAKHDTKFISSQTGLGRRVVQNWIKRFRDQGEDALPTRRPKSGRPKLVSARTSEVISQQLKADPTLSARQVKEKNPQLLGHCSLRCIQQHLRDDLGFRSFRAGKKRRKPRLTIDQKEKRVKFCKKYAVWDPDSWRSVLWSDVATFSVKGSGVGKNPPSLMVWAGFSYHGVGELVIVPKSLMLDQYHYLELLCDYLPDSFEKASADFFMHDDAPSHTAKSVKQWLYDCEVPFFSDWPGRSQDLNPIEDLWSIVEYRLRDRNTSSIPQLEAAIRDIWYNLTPGHLQNLADSVPRRLQDCLEQKGNAIKYQHMWLLLDRKKAVPTIHAHPPKPVDPPVDKTQRTAVRKRQLARILSEYEDQERADVFSEAQEPQSCGDTKGNKAVLITHATKPKLTQSPYRSSEIHAALEEVMESSIPVKRKKTEVMSEQEAYSAYEASDSSDDDHMSDLDSYHPERDMQTHTGMSDIKTEEEDLTIKEEEDITIKEEEDITIKEEEDITIKEDLPFQKEEDMTIKEEDITIKEEDITIKEEDIPIMEEDITIKEEEPELFSLDMQTKERVLSQSQKQLVTLRKAWEAITTAFNAVNPDQNPRSWLEMKRSFDHVKRKVKDGQAQYQKTGGEPSTMPPSLTEDMERATAMTGAELAKGDDVIETFIFQPMENFELDIHQLADCNQYSTPSSIIATIGPQSSPKPVTKVALGTVPGTSPFPTALGRPTEPSSQQPHTSGTATITHCSTSSSTPDSISGRPVSRSKRRKVTDEYEACRNRQQEHLVLIRQMKKIQETQLKELEERKANIELKKKLDELKIEAHKMKVEMKKQKQSRNVVEQEARIRLNSVAEETATLALHRLRSTLDKLDQLHDTARETY